MKKKSLESLLSYERYEWVLLCRCEYDDWRLQVACMLQPIPFPEQYVLLRLQFCITLLHYVRIEEWEFPFPICPMEIRWE